MLLLDTMYSIPSAQDVEKVVIDESMIQGESEPLLVYSSDDPKQASAED